MPPGLARAYSTHTKHPSARTPPPRKFHPLAAFRQITGQPAQAAPVPSAAEIKKAAAAPRTPPKRATCKQFFFCKQKSTQEANGIRTNERYSGLQRKEMCLPLTHLQERKEIGPFIRSSRCHQKEKGRPRTDDEAAPAQRTYPSGSCSKSLLPVQPRSPRQTRETRQARRGRGRGGGLVGQRRSMEGKDVKGRPPSSTTTTTFTTTSITTLCPANTPALFNQKRRAAQRWRQAKEWAPT